MVLMERNTGGQPVSPTRDAVAGMVVAVTACGGSFEWWQFEFGFVLDCSPVR
jgi:hypothetical protein